MNKKTILVLVSLCFCSICLNTYALADVIYLSPVEAGNGTGTNSENAFSYTDENIWNKVNQLLESNDVTVYLTKGHYSTKPLEMVKVGNAKHKLVISGEKKGVIMDAPVKFMITLKECKNITINNFNFTGSTKGYCFVITNHSENIDVQNCKWNDLPELYYGCVGVHNGSQDITFRNCIFKNAGKDGHHHFFYIANDANYVSILDCYLEDSAGSYIRFRNHSDYGRVSRNTFVSTGKGKNYDPNREVFVALENFTDVNPGDEWFGTNYIITNNTFKFTKIPADISDKDSAIRIGLRIRNDGFNYPGKNYLMTAEEGAILTGNKAILKKQLLLKNYGIDFNKIYLRNNVWKNEKWKMGFTSLASFGAKSKGWTGNADISDILNPPQENQYENEPCNPCTVKSGSDKNVTPISSDKDFWQVRHKGIMQKARNGKVDMIMIGDSITHRWEERPDRQDIVSGKKVWDKYYAHRNVLNMGIDGDRTQNVLWRLQNGELDNINPKLAILLIGTNNSNTRSNTDEQIANGIKAIVCELKRKLPSTKILIIGILPRGDRYDCVNKMWVATYNFQWAKNDQVNNIICKIANNRDVYFLDIGQKLLNKDGVLTKDITSDLVHFSEKGYQIWAEAMEPVVTKLMGEKID
jgi:lysophospholipase L1-like esterase